MAMSPPESLVLIFQAHEDSLQRRGWKQWLFSHCNHPQPFPGVMPKHTTVRLFVTGEQSRRRGSACGTFIEEHSPALRQRGLEEANLAEEVQLRLGGHPGPEGP